ncbi:MAG: MBL fold metallo-hydrolase [Janthinobacterium lividum]
MATAQSLKVLQMEGAEIFRVPEVDKLAYEPAFFFPGPAAEVIGANLPALAPWSVDSAGKILVNFQSFVIKTRERLIVVDPANGNHKTRPGMVRWNMLDLPFLERFASLGVRPEQVDLVLCSHLHADHVGWNTQLVDGKWVPTFPHAEHLITRVEHEYWTERQREDPTQRVNHGAFDDSVQPIIDAGLMRMVEMDALVFDDGTLRISFEPAPGHTPGSVHIVLRSGGQEAILSADSIHHPLEVIAPHVGPYFDIDSALAQKTRSALIERCAATDAYLIPAHFPWPVAGKVKRAGDAFEFVFNGDVAA